MLAALAEDLRGLGTVDVPAAARERTWALLRQELEQRPVAALNGASSRRSTRETPGLRRWALGSVALVAVSALALVVAFAGFGDGDADQVAGADTQTTQVVVGPGMDDPTPGTDVTSGPGGSEDPGASAPEGTVPEGGTSTTNGPDATDVTPRSTTPPTTGTPSTTHPPTTKPPTTTEPPQTTTTGRAVMTRKQQVSSASAAADFVAKKVMAGDPIGASSVLAGTATRQVVQLATSLENPGGYKIDVVRTDESGGRVLVVFTDWVDDGQGDVVETPRSFFMDVRFNDGGAAVVTAISKATGS